LTIFLGYVQAARHFIRVKEKLEDKS